MKIKKSNLIKKSFEIKKIFLVKHMTKLFPCTILAQCLPALPHALSQYLPAHPRLDEDAR